MVINLPYSNFTFYVQKILASDEQEFPYDSDGESEQTLYQASQLRGKIQTDVSNSLLQESFSPENQKRAKSCEYTVQSQVALFVPRTEINNSILQADILLKGGYSSIIVSASKP